MSQERDGEEEVPLEQGGKSDTRAELPRRDDDPAFTGAVDPAFQLDSVPPRRSKSARASETTENGTDAVSSTSKVRPWRLAVVLLVLFPVLGYVFFFVLLPAERSKRPAPSSTSSYPDAPFHTTTDRPMTAGEIDAWLKEDNDTIVIKGSSPGSADPELPPGHLYVPKEGEAIALDPSRTPTRPTRPTQPVGPQAASPTSTDPSGSSRSGWPSLGPAQLPFMGQQPARPGDAKRAFVYEPGTIKNSDVFETPEKAKAPEAQWALLEVGDSFVVRLHSGLSSVSSDNVVLASAAEHVRKRGRLVIPRGAIIRGTIRTYGERRFFLSFGEFKVGDVPYRFEGRAEERNYAGLLATRREATLEERQRSTLINGVLSGLVGASAVAAQALPAGAREASQVITRETRDNTLREERVREGFVLEAPKGKSFRILVTR